MTKCVNIGKDYSRYPAGRFPSDGKYNGQTFREKFLAPSLRLGETVEIALDDAVDYGSSFLEEAFGGLVRVERLDPQFVIDHLNLNSQNYDLLEEIRQHITSAMKS